MSIDSGFATLAKYVSRMAGRPMTFVAAITFIVIWALTGPAFGFSDTWQLIVNTSTTIVTFLMVFVIQNSQNRDAAAMQAKLDELVRAVEQARNGLIGVEHLTDRELDDLLKELEAECAEGPMHPSSRTHKALRSRLLHLGG